MATYDITAYGAVSGGSAATNRTAFIAAHTACAASGDEIYIPDGFYEFAWSAGTYVININKSVTVRGQSRLGATLSMTAANAITETTIQLFNVTGDSVTFKDLTMDGNKPAPNTVTAYDPLLEHHPGIFYGPDTAFPTVQNCVFRNFTGDAVDFYSGCTDVLMEDCLIEYCQRDGISFNPTDPTRPVNRAIIRRNIFREITVQPIDNEHGPAINVEIYENEIDPGLNSFAVTISGYSDILYNAARSRNWHVYNNELHGGIFVIRCDDILIEENYGTNTSRKPSVDINRSANNITVRNNDFLLTQMESVSVPAIRAIGTQADVIDDPHLYPSGILIENNRLETSHGSSWGVQLHAVLNATVTGNVIQGPGITAAGYAGVLVRATLPERDMETFVITNNFIRDWGQYGVRVQGTGASKIQYVRVSNNTIENTIVPAVMTTGVNLNDGTNALQSGVVAKNLYGTGVTNTLINIPPAPASIAQTLGGGTGGGFKSSFGRTF